MADADYGGEFRLSDYVDYYRYECPECHKDTRTADEVATWSVCRECAARRKKEREEKEAKEKEMKEKDA